MTSMTYCTFENLDHDIANVLDKHERGVWDNEISLSEYDYTISILERITELREVLQEICDNHEPHQN